MAFGTGILSMKENPDKLLTPIGHKNPELILFDCQADVLTFHRRRSGLRRDVMAVQMSASGQKQ